MPPDSAKYFRYQRGYDMPATIIDKTEYEESTRGCSKGIARCDQEYKKCLKYARTQFKYGNKNYTDVNGKLIRPVACKQCALARDFYKTCEIQYENHFYGYAKESDSQRTVYFHWSNNWHPNFGTSCEPKDTRMVPIGVPDKQSYDNLFRLSIKPENKRIKTPKEDEFISGYIEENKNGPYRGRLQWTKWFRHSLTFTNWTKITRSAIENKSMQCMVNQPKMMIAKMIYDQNKLIEGMDKTSKTPCNCEPISKEHWILAAITMVAFLGIRPKNRDIFDNYGGISKVGTLNYFTFLENINNPHELYRLTTLDCESLPVEITIHNLDFTQTKNDQMFWSNVSNTFKNMPFCKKVERQPGFFRQIEYNVYHDGNSIEHSPYYNPAPYYNSAHGYNPHRYVDFNNGFLDYTNTYEPQQNYPVYPYFYPPQTPKCDSGSDSRKRSNSSMSAASETSLLQRGLRDIREVKRKYPKIDKTYRRYTHRELKELILNDVRREESKMLREKRRSYRCRRNDSVSSDDDQYTRERVRCREDSGRENNGHRQRDDSPDSVDSASSNYRRPYPSYDELLEQVTELKRGLDDREKEKKKEKMDRWKTLSSESEDF